MKTNFFGSGQTTTTHEGAPSSPVPPLLRLRRLTMACMLWEDQFYVDGKTIAENIEDCCKTIKPEKIVEQALEAHQKGLLRHIPLFLILQALKRGAKCKEAIAKICSRPDQMTELLSLYWKEGKKPLAAQLKKGLAKAFNRFDEYALGKYNRDAPVKLRDVLFLCHAKPKDEAQAELWKRLISNTMATPETWETKLSAGEDKKDSFQELLEKSKMGALAIIRNFRNMQNAGVPKQLVERELMKNRRPLLPFQFLAAAKACPQWEDLADKAMVQSAQAKDKLPGITAVFVDVSGSMDSLISAKSQLMRMDAACAMGILLREICEQVDIFTFSQQLAVVPPRSGMALRDAIVNSQPHGGTYLGLALRAFSMNQKKGVPVERIIVITDEQAHDVPPRMLAKRCYILNIGSCENGIKNNGQWHTITGFSEHVIDYIAESERETEEVELYDAQ